MFSFPRPSQFIEFCILCFYVIYVFSVVSFNVQSFESSCVMSSVLDFHRCLVESESTSSTESESESRWCVSIEVCVIFLLSNWSACHTGGRINQNEKKKLKKCN